MKLNRRCLALSLEQLEDRTVLSTVLPLTLTAAPAGTLPILPNHSLLTNQAQLQIVGTTLPGDTVRLETGRDNLFDEGSAVADGGGNYSLTTPSLKEGLNLLRLQVTDGNRQANAQLLVTLDDQAPTVTITQPAANVVTSQNPILIGKVKGTGSTVSSLQVDVDSQASFSNLSFNAATGAFTFTPNLLLDGSADRPHTVYFQATDQAGNQSVTAFNFVLDTAPPTIVSTSLNNLPPNKIIDGTGPGISFVFSKPLDPTTVTDSTFKLTGPKGVVVPLTPHFSNGNTQLVLTASSFLPVGSYHFTVNAPEVRDLLGGALVAATHIWKFKVSRTYTWINKTGGDFNNPANWDRGQVPGANDIAIIPVGVGTITDSGTNTIASLTNGSPVQLLTGGTLTVTGNIQANNTYTLDGGDLQGATVLGKGLTLSNAGGTLDGVTLGANLNGQSPGATAAVIDGLTLKNNATLFLGNNAANNPTFATLVFNNTETLGGTGSVVFGTSENNSLQAYAPLTLGSGITLHGASATLAGTIINQGTVNADTKGGILTIDPIATGATFTNQGTMKSTLGVLVFSPDPGTAFINNGTLVKGEGYAVNGQGEGGDITINGDFTQGSSGILEYITGGQHDPNGGGFHVTGQATLAGTLDIVPSNGFVPVAGDGGEAVRYGSVSGAFDTLEVTPSLSAGLALQGTYTDSGLVVKVVPVTSPEFITQTNLNDSMTFPGGGGQTVFFQFSQPLDPATVTASNFQLTDADGTVPVNLQLSNNNTVVSFTIPAALTGSSQFTINSAAVKDTQGHALGTTNLTWSFQAGLTFNWTGQGDGTSFDDPNNWDLGQVPGAGDAVVIDGPANTTINFSEGDISIGSLVSANPFSLTGGVLTVAGTFEVDNTFTLAGGTLRGAHVLAGSGGQGITLTGQGGTLDGVTTDADIDGTQGTNEATATIVNGLTLNNATISLGNDDPNSPSFGTLDFANTETLGGTGTVVFGTNPSNNLQADDALTLGARITLHGASGTLSGSIINQGTINADTEGGVIAISPTTNGATFTNLGTMTSDLGVLDITPSAGTAFVNNGTLVKGEGYAVNSQGAGGAITINGDFTQGSTGTIEFVVGGQNDPNGGGFHITGQATLAGTLNIEPSNGFVPAAGDGGKSVKYGSVSGAFDTLEVTPSLAAGLAIQGTYTANALDVQIVQVG